MRLGVHLPLAYLFDGEVPAPDLSAYARAARDLGYATLAANDHLVWRRPWLDGPTALASVLDAAGDMTLATTVTLPVVRHPVVVAKTLSTLAAIRVPGVTTRSEGEGVFRRLLIVPQPDKQ